jgi:lysophospholipase L1-like esterase
MAFSLVAVLAVGELVLGRIMPNNIFNPRFGLRPYSRTVMRVELPGITPGGIMSTNMWGFRGEDPPESWDEHITIVTVGGSTTANYYLDDSLTWSHVLQEELRQENPLVWVGNAGIPRHSSDTHLLFTREVLSEIQPDIALFLVGVNDMGPFLRSNADEERLPDSGPRQWLFSNSQILQLIYKAKVVHLDRAPVVTAAADPEFTEEPLEAPEDLLPEDLHSLLENPDFYRRRIALLIEECLELGITPVFLTQPILYQDSHHWRGIRAADRFAGGEERPISAATFAGMLGTLNQDLIQVCSENDALCFDLAGEVPCSYEYFYDAMHMTEAGADLVGRLVADFLREYITIAGTTGQVD